MKTRLTLGLRLRGAVAAGALAALVGGLAPASAGPSASPVGQWDCNINGDNQKGMAFFTFTDENTNGGTFSVVRFLAGKHSGNSGSSTTVLNTGRGGEGIGRDGSEGSTNASSSSSFTNLWGLDMLTGTWQFDAKGKIIGRFAEIIGAGSVSCTTNENITTVNATTQVPVTNIDGSITYYETNTFIFVTNGVTINCVTNGGTTNAVSFTGKATAKKLTLVSSSANGKISYSGTTYTSNLTDLSGYWYATRKHDGQSDLIDFTLAPVSPDLPNVYFTSDGAGPTDSFEGYAVLSKRKQIGFVFSAGSTNDTFTATMGTLKTGKTSYNANTKGNDLSTSPGTPVQINATKKL
jgi:hypothetical protein